VSPKSVVQSIGRSIGGLAIEAIRGTKIELTFQTNLDLKNIGMVLPGGEFVTARDAGHRTFNADLILRESGRLGFRGKDVNDVDRQDPLGHEIRALADEPPKVTLEQPESDQEVDFTSEVDFRYRVTDDFGLTSVRLELTGESFSRDIPLPEVHGRGLGGNYRLPLARLGLPRQIHRLVATFVAKDNDAVSGAKEGRSRSVSLLFKNPEEVRKNRLNATGQWLEIFLEVLGGDLEPKGSVPEQYSETWVGQWKQGLEKFKGLETRIASEQEKDRSFRRLVQDVRTSLRRLVSAREEVIGRLGPSAEIWARHRAAFPAKLDREVAELERVVLLLDRFATGERARQSSQASEDLMDLTQELESRLDKLFEKGDAREIEEALRSIREALSETAKSLAALAEKGAPEFVNREALSDKDLPSLNDELQKIQDLLQAGKMDEARKRLAEYLERLRELTRQWKKGLGSMAQGSDQQLRKELSAATEELRQLRKAEEKLVDQTLDLEKRRSEKRLREMPNLPDELMRSLRQLKSKMEIADRESKQELTEPWAGMSRDQIPRIRQKITELEREVNRRRFDLAEPAISEIEKNLDRLTEQGKRLRGIFDRAIPPALPGGIVKGLQPSQEALDAARDIHQQLAEMRSKQNEQSMTAEEMESARKLGEKQKELRGRTGRFQQTLSKLGRKVPSLGQESQEKLGQAGQQMDEAAKRLQEGTLSPALPHEREAIVFLEDLQQQMEQAQSQGGGMMMSMPEQMEGMGEGSGQISTEPMLLPEPSRMEETQAWRKKVMDAMKQKPPAGYEDVTRDYFQELAK